MKNQIKPLADLDVRYTVRAEACGCLVRSKERNGGGDKYILFCREHRAAPDMLAALNHAENELIRLRASIAQLAPIRAAIAKATGGAQ
jgi:hypothetical protein